LVLRACEGRFRPSYQHLAGWHVLPPCRAGRLPGVAPDARGPLVRVSARGAFGRNTRLYLHRRTGCFRGRPRTSRGLVDASLREIAEGCATSPVGYIEGIYVRPECRRQGIDRALVAAAEAWAISRGCSEMASDCLLENSESEFFHRELGYSVVERLIHFRRALSR
jgi:GNAT superfamily N-acetyltransferase